jgi:hypothetical protein
MPIQVYWEDPEQTIVRYDFEGSWTWDEMYAAFYEGVAMETSITHRVDVILNLQHSGRIPGNILLHTKNFSEKQPPNVGFCIFVTTNLFLISLFNTAIKFYAKIAFYFRLTKTIEEAHVLIAAGRRVMTKSKLS